MRQEEQIVNQYFNLRNMKNTSCQKVICCHGSRRLANHSHISYHIWVLGQVEIHRSTSFPRTVPLHPLDTRDKLLGRRNKKGGHTPQTRKVDKTSRAWHAQTRRKRPEDNEGLKAKIKLKKKVETASSVCGGKLLNSSGSFSSPFYPRPSPPRIQCIWEIEVPENFQIKLIFNKIRLELSSGCKYDYIDIFDGSQNSSPLLGKICSASNETFLSSSNKMRVQFFTGSRFANSGFEAYYYTIHQENNGTALSCSEDQMQATISRKYLQSLGYNPQNLLLSNSSCEPHITSKYVIFNIPFNSCGTVIQETNTTITYSNVITTSPSSSIITRKRSFRLHVSCRMSQNTVVQIMDLVDNALEISRTQDGHYGMSISFYNSALFQHPVTASPYYVDLNQDLFLQIALLKSNPDLMLLMDTCMASPYANDFKTLTYNLTQNGCVRDDTFRIYSSPSPDIIRFKFNAFKFLNQHSEVYLQCKIVVCRTNQRSSRCFQGCTPRSKRESKQEAQPGQEKVSLVVGPIKLQGKTIKEKRSGLAKDVVPEPGGRGSWLEALAMLLGAMTVGLAASLLKSKS
ncbi:deleted in malignant brain tumors 1 protein-like [Ornithorhynchus anatinus]|uniref:deleted in malignant brain tumors 1 protein-like n=1 Tax=Ornithorhynchus anatinus TaxID=9258 RepID=UPI0019D4500C|nr:deleted in malignant brain tumors 1 protein-like [Ornithorhynchus anatinus]